MEEHRRSLREQALALPSGDPPAPWSPGRYFHAGGVIAAGWDVNENILLVSHDGYSLTDARTERRLLRNRDSDAGYEGLSQERLSFTSPETGEVITVFGIYGGDGIHVTADGWRLERIAPDWPDEIVLLRKPRKGESGMRSSDYFYAAHRLALPLGGTMRGCGFSPSGMQLMVVASDGAVAYSRARNNNSASVVVISSGRTPLGIIPTPPPSSASALVMATSGDFGWALWCSAARSKLAVLGS